MVGSSFFFGAFIQFENGCEGWKKGGAHWEEERKKKRPYRLPLALVTQDADWKCYPPFFFFPRASLQSLAIASPVGPLGRDGPSRAEKWEINQNDNYLKDIRYL